jgi:ABC-2 type transport system ATP-binding protein
LLATHYIEEAEQLCDRVVMLKEGRIVADGTPEDLAAGSGSEMTIVIAGPERMDDSSLTRAGIMRTGRHGRYHHYTARNPSSALREVIELVDAGACEIRDLRIRAPRLEDLYLRLLDTPQTCEPGGEPVP